MLKRIILAGILLGLVLNQSAQALTGPDDVVGVHLYNGELAKDQFKYFKKWKEINLSAATKAALLQKNKGFENTYEKFKIHFLFIADDTVQRVFFLGDSGTVVMMDWPNGEICSLSFDSNGGYAGVTKRACRDN